MAVNCVRLGNRDGEVTQDQLRRRVRVMGVLDPPCRARGHCPGRNTGGSGLQRSFFGIAVFALLSVMGQLGCGNGASSGPMGPPNPVPTIQALSPNSSKQGGPTFTLSVVGSNFVPSSEARWNGSGLQITFVSSKLVTANIPASFLSVSRPGMITIVNPAPGGGTSNSMSVTVPCVIAAPAPASTQTRARLGVYYFDGWSGPLTNFHFQGLPFGPYQDRQPIYGWQDNSECAVEQQLASAHNFGIDFFVFDWYFNTQVNASGENLNSALQITRSLPDRHGMHYAILYVDSPPFVVGQADWTAAVSEWIGYMTDPAYLLVNSKPLLVVLDMQAMRQAFGSSASVANAFNQLRAAAQAKGLPGVLIAGGIFGGYDPTRQSGSFPDLSMAIADGYDVLTMYNYSVSGVSGTQPFSTLSDAAHWIWAQGALKSPLPFIPVAMDGWDARPWNESNVWFSRSPQDVSGLVRDAIIWANSNPQLRPEPSSAPPIVLVEAWNELGEGSFLVPTFGDGTSYGDALAAMLLMP
jgi:hypothetical protein